jgi:hypothetical protein
MGNFTEEIHGLVEAGELEGALDRLLECLAGGNARLRNEAILHKALLNQNNRNVRQALITNDDAERVRARINLAVLSLLTDFEGGGAAGRGERGKNVTPGAPPRPAVSGRGDGEIRILFLSANPLGTARIRVDEELSRIGAELRASAGREKLFLSQRVAVTAAALLQAILDERPHVVHFAGHGTEGGIILENGRGGHQPVTEKALENLFALFSNALSCVVLNACYSEGQARAIARWVPYVVGMSSAMPDAGAISFSTGFYKALGAGGDFEFAYRVGLSSVQLEGLAGDEIPLLLRQELAANGPAVSGGSGGQD